jgi:hypothetical protein
MSIRFTTTMDPDVRMKIQLTVTPVMIITP